MAADRDRSWEVAQLVVDLHSLADVHALVMNELNTFEGKVVPALSSVADGVPFGVVTGLTEMDTARPRYQDCLDQGRAAINSFHEGTLRFAQAADLIVKQYAGSDAFAAAQPKDVATALAQNPTLNPAASDSDGAL